jgi:hypothetical protein
MYTVSMKQSTHSVHKKLKKKMGRPATGHDPAVTTRLPAEVLAAVEEWALANECKRAVAIARLVELGLAASAKKKRPK